MTPRPKRLARMEPEPKQKLRLWLRLLRTTRTIEAELRERLRVQFNTTLPRFDVLAALHRKEAGMTMTALSRQLLVSNGNITGIIDRLVADGLVMRMADARDRRATFVRLTREGAQQFAVLARVHETWVTELLADIQADDAHLIMRVLEPHKTAVLQEM
jgi:DNA-binding MarR family transcriptional regulator